VPAAFVPRLFDRYSRDVATVTGGSGLGLSVVRDLVGAHHGTIEYDRASNAFVVTLPPLPVSDTSATEQPETPEPAAPQPDRAASLGA
jgi:signal transduction histidine kinase